MESPKVPQSTPNELADDMLRGADEIAAFIFGERGSRRKVYYLAECSRLPVFRLGSVLCARKSVLLQWISGQESRVKGSSGWSRTGEAGRTEFIGPKSSAALSRT
jgi:hypothetical protein